MRQRLERTYSEMMRDYLKNELGVESLPASASAHRGGLPPYPLLSSTCVPDIVAGQSWGVQPGHTARSSSR